MNIPDTMIFMPCHAIFLGDLGGGGIIDDESNWSLLPFQMGNGHLPLLIAHIETACNFARDNPNALLIFSGGQTRLGVHRTEGESQIDVANRLGYLSGIEAERVTYEAFAQDSFQNCAFSMARFIELTGYLPRHVVAVGWEFKRQRFLDHMTALLGPSSSISFDYQGVNQPPPSHLGSAIASEALIRKAFSLSPHGDSTFLLAKKRDRNWARRRHGYLRSVAPVSPELAFILEKQFE